MIVIRLIKAVVALAEQPGAATAADLFIAVAEAALPFVPHEQLAASLSDAARKRAEAIANAAEDAKFGPKP